MREGLIGSSAAWWLTESRKVHPSGHLILVISAPFTGTCFRISTIELASCALLRSTKGGYQFQFRRYIQTGMHDVHRRLVQSKFLKGLSPNEFARQAGVIIGDVNYIHPFREGNGRAQAQYLKQLAAQAGHDLDLRRLDLALWIEASKSSHGADYELMVGVIRQALAGPSKR
jgi:Fic/DOC family